MLTLLTKVYPEDSLRYRIDESIHKGNYLFGKTLKNKVQRLKEEAYVEKENFIIYFYPFGKDNGPVFRNNKLPEVRQATPEDEANGYVVKGFECFDAEYQPEGATENVMKAWPVKDTRGRYIVYMGVDDYDAYYYVYIGSAGGWFDVSEYYDRVGLKGGGVWVDNLPKNIKKIRPYKFWKSVLDVQQKITHFFYRCMHMIDSCYLCIRFPFLYPRNRFTGRHYNNWKLSDYEKRLYEDAVFSPSIKFPKNETKIPKFDLTKHNFPYVQRRDFTEYKIYLKEPYNKEVYTTDADGNEIILFSPKAKNEGTLVRFICDYDDELGEIYREATYSPKFGWVFFDEYREAPNYQPLEFDHEDYVSRHMSFMISPEKYWKRNFIAWFHKNVLGTIFFVPTSSEIDAMENGWFRAFGMDFLKELKAQLKKEGRLYKYRIMQIKEKYGRWIWYDASSSDEVFNLIEKYSEISSKICIDCGRPADYITTGYILPLCEKHISEEGKLSAHDLRKSQTEESEEENEEKEEAES